MTKIASLLTLLVTVLVALLPAAPALAQRDRVFVASYGSDSNPCTFGSPCKTFQQAVNVVAVGGEVTAIDSAGFGAINITKSVTITSPNGVEAGIAASAGADAIGINAPSATVVLRGLTLEGANAADDGINVSNGSRVEVIDCIISDFADYGIFIQTGAPASVLISSTIVKDAPKAVYFAATGSGLILGSLDHVTLSNNFNGPSSNEGLVLMANGVGSQSNEFNSIEVLVTNSLIEGYYTGISATGILDSNSVVELNDVALNGFTDGIVLNAFSIASMSRVTGGFSFNSNVNPVILNTNTSIANSDGSNHMGTQPTGGSFSTWARH